MKRSDMVKLIENAVLDSVYVDPETNQVFFPNNEGVLGEKLLMAIEEAGMKPPALGGDEAQALMRVYVYPSFNMWDEEFHKDEKVAEAFKKIMMREKR